MSKPVRTLTAPAFLAAGLFAFISSVAGQTNPQELLNREKAAQATLTSRLETNMRTAIAEARRLQATSPVRAANALKSAIAQLDDPLIPRTFRAEWTAQLTAQIKLIESGKRLPDPVVEDPKLREIKDARARDAKAIQDEYYDVRRSVDTISALIKAGNTAQAQREADALGKRYPNNPVVISMNENVAWNQRIAEAKDYVEQQKQGYLLAMRSVDRSAIPPKEDLEFDPEYFRKISKLRQTGTKLTKKETAIMKALDEPITLSYKDSTFDEVIKFISTKMGQEILLDKASLAEANVTSATPVSIDLKSVATRTALRKLLQDNGLTFIMRDEAIQVMTTQQARSLMVTRVYPIGDIVRMIGPFGGAVTFGPWMEAAQMQESAKQIVALVMTVDPNSWKEAGGNGTIAFHWPTLSLIVRQTAEVHAKLGGLSR